MPDQALVNLVAAVLILITGGVGVVGFSDFENNLKKKLWTKIEGLNLVGLAITLILFGAFKMPIVLIYPAFLTYLGLGTYGAYRTTIATSW